MLELTVPSPTPPPPPAPKEKKKEKKEKKNIKKTNFESILDPGLSKDPPLSKYSPYLLQAHFSENSELNLLTN